MNIATPLPTSAATHSREPQDEYMKLPAAVQELLRCPVCGARLRSAAQQLQCVSAACSSVFPVINGIPVLINERTSIFSIGDFAAQHTALLPGKHLGTLRHWVKTRLPVPTITSNIAAQGNFEVFAQALLAHSATPRVLLVGGGPENGKGIEALLAHPSIELVTSDVVYGDAIGLICDAHDVPFDGQAFDGVVVQAVLEHVADPYRCVEEIHRVLKPGGLVYAETPFMQQVHMGPYDFTRFTHLGHRRLFRRFEELDSGAACGPGTALAWSYQYFLLSFAKARATRFALKAFARLTSFYLKYLDGYLARKAGAFDAASAYYFLGRKSEQVLSDKQLIKLYKGAL